MLDRFTRTLFVVALLFTMAAADMPASDITFGGDLRLRAEGFNNLLDLEDGGDSLMVMAGAETTWTTRNDDYEYLRFRARLWLKAEPRDGLSLFFRLGNEYRYGRGENISGVKDPESKVSLDNAWATISRPRMALTFGRMDLQYGEGFLVFDGTPADGSSSAWFDAIKLTVIRPLGTLDLFYAQIDEEGFGGSSRDEDLFGLYGVRGGIETYVLRRTKVQSTSSASGTLRPRGCTTAFGARLVHQPRQGFSFAAEGAYQRGEKEDVDRDAYGGYARLAWRDGGRLGPGLELGGLYLSGDDPATTTYEGWDGFYGEWPKYSELLVYTLYDNTTRITPNEPGTWTNVVAGWVEAGIGIPKGRLIMRVTPLRAAEKGTGPGVGLNRGLLFSGRANIELGKGIHGQLHGELFEPDDFYAEEADPAWYARWQIVTAF